jgi:hypothetical protein
LKLSCICLIARSHNKIICYSLMLLVFLHVVPVPFGMARHGTVKHW